MKTLTDVKPCPSCGAQPGIYSGTEWMNASENSVPVIGVPPSFFVVGCIGPGHSTDSGSWVTRKGAIDCWNKMAR